MNRTRRRNSPTRWLCSYNYNGDLYSHTVVADTRDEALERLMSMSRGSVDGPLYLRFWAPSWLGWLVLPCVNLFIRTADFLEKRR